MMGVCVYLLVGCACVLLFFLLGTQFTWHKSTNTDAKVGAVLGVAKALGFRKQKQLTYADVC